MALQGDRKMRKCKGMGKYDSAMRWENVMLQGNVICEISREKENVR